MNVDTVEDEAVSILVADMTNTVDWVGKHMRAVLRDITELPDFVPGRIARTARPPGSGRLGSG
jgi:hypothetical protein